MSKIYIKDVVRKLSLFDVKAWYEGESKEFEKWTGSGFYNTIFNSENGMVEVYYDKEEVDKFEKVLNEKLDEEFFDEICDDFFQLIEDAKEAVEEMEIFDISIRAWPALIIFDEISKYPEWATESMLRRLVRIRNATESFHYDLSKKVDHSKFAKNYVFFQGKVFYLPFEKFLEVRGFGVK